MRVYVPSTLSLLAAAYAAGEVASVPVTAYAVTPALREWYVAGDEEELEYAAMIDAARASLRLLERDPGAPRRRVVLAADVPDAAVTLTPDMERAAVLLSVAVPLRDVVSVHVDGREAEADVTAAAKVIAAADLGDDDAIFTVGGVEDHQLMWFATQEIPELLRGL